MRHGDDGRDIWGIMNMAEQLKPAAQLNDYALTAKRFELAGFSKVFRRKAGASRPRPSAAQSLGAPEQGAACKSGGPIWPRLPST